MKDLILRRTISKTVTANGEKFYYTLMVNGKPTGHGTHFDTVDDVLNGVVLRELDGDVYVWCSRDSAVCCIGHRHSWQSVPVYTGTWDDAFEIFAAHVRML